MEDCGLDGRCSSSPSLRRNIRRGTQALLAPERAWRRARRAQENAALALRSLANELIHEQYNRLHDMIFVTVLPALMLLVWRRFARLVWSLWPFQNVRASRSRLKPSDSATPGVDVGEPGSVRRRPPLDQIPQRREAARSHVPPRGRSVCGECC